MCVCVCVCVCVYNLMHSDSLYRDITKHLLSL